jgi:hypothetical protein
MTEYHEPANELSQETRDFTRALKTLMEEVEAVDWYQQRVDVSKNESLRKIMEHNRDEEIEHACMTLEWLRRNMPSWDDEMKTYLFTEGDITELEDEEEDDNSSATNDGSLGLSK